MPRGERLEVLVRTETDLAQARIALSGLNARFHQQAYGDIWLRDTMPIFLHGERGELGSTRFVFNGWGGKYRLPGDSDLSERAQSLVQGAHFALPFVCEGGALEVDGQGTVLTTKQCLLNPNRNPKMDQHAVERVVSDALSVSKIVWIERGLLNDHTDGHIDTIARFVAPGVAVCMAPSGYDDPNAEVLDEISQTLRSVVDAQGRALRVVRIPSPGRVVDEEGEIMPASYVNFYIANTTVVVPTYGSQWDEKAVSALAQLFPKHRVIGCPSKTILEGGGAFHCITQQQPAARIG
jgi:agmatine deiminase